MSIPNQTLVSVIIPFLNASQWLTEAVESVISQSYLHWELVLIDDGSKEEHSRVARAYRDQYPKKIIYTDHPFHRNMGVTISRNLGISLTKGAYIAFLDSDDYWLPQKLENQLALFNLHPEAAMVCEASRFWYSWEDPLREDVIVPVGVAPDQLYTPPQLLFDLYPLGKGSPPCPTGIMLRKSAFNRAGGFEEAFTGVNQLYEDQALLCKIYLQEKVYISGSVHNVYRKRRGSITESFSDEKKYYRSRRFFLNWLETYVRRQSINNHKLLPLIQQSAFDIRDL